MKVAISGASGLIGRALVTQLRASNHEVTELVRRPPATSAHQVRWFPEREDVFGDRENPTFDAVVHLGGAPIGQGRWTKSRREEITSSRVVSTRHLAATLARRSPSTHLVVASAIGFYGSRHDEVLSEASTPGDGFLADVCRAWEGAADPLRDSGGVVSHLRTGLVISPTGGALERQLPLFRLGLGGKLGTGQQWWSVIALADEISAIEWIVRARLEGLFNLVGPEPATNATFTRELAHYLRRPALLSVPAPALRGVLGARRAEELILSSQRVIPSRLIESGFSFRYPSLREIIVGELGRPPLTHE